MFAEIGSSTDKNRWIMKFSDSASEALEALVLDSANADGLQLLLRWNSPSNGWILLLVGFKIYPGS